MCRDLGARELFEAAATAAAHAAAAHAATHRTLPQRKDSGKDLEGAVQAVFQRFTGSLQKILEDIDRWVLQPPCSGRPGARAECLARGTFSSTAPSARALLLLGAGHGDGSESVG